MGFRRNDDDLSTVSLKTQMDTTRVFVRWLGTIDAIDPELHVKEISSDLRDDDNVREGTLESENAEAIAAALTLASLEKSRRRPSPSRSTSGCSERSSNPISGINCSLM